MYNLRKCSIYFLLIVSFLCFLNVLITYIYEFVSCDNHPYAKSQSVIIFKLPRSGSSWFTDLLNGLPCLYIAKEIIQSGDLNHFSSSEMEVHLSKALQAPSDKLSFSRAITFSGRFFEDFYFHKSLKFLRKLNCIGFTINPEYCAGISWQRVLKGAYQPRIIIYSRRNVVKATISSFRGKQMKALCGQSNLPRGEAAVKCQRKMPKHLNISVPNFMRELYYWQSRVDQFERTLRNWNAIQSLPILRVYYEDLQFSQESVMQKVQSFLSSELSAAPLSNAGRWVKRSPDDLRELLVGFDEILAALMPSDGLSLVRNVSDPCHCWREQLLEGSDSNRNKTNNYASWRCERSEYDLRGCFEIFLQ